jgi:hypothetical protein
MSLTIHWPPRRILILFRHLVGLWTSDQPVANVSTHTRQQKKQSCPTTRHEGAWGERRYSFYSFLTSALDGGEWSASRPDRALSRERTPGAHCTGGWVGLRAGLDTEARGKILCPCRGSNPDRPVRSQTLFWLSYSSYTRQHNTESRRQTSMR